MRNRVVIWGGALGLWTLLVWVGRIRNVVGADDIGGFGKLWRLVVAVGFVVVGAAVTIGVLSSVKKATKPAAVGSLVVGLAVVGSGWWLIRGGQILIGDWDTSFKVVHTLLATATFGFSAMAWRAVRSQQLASVSHG